MSSKWKGLEDDVAAFIPFSELLLAPKVLQLFHPEDDVVGLLLLLLLLLGRGDEEVVSVDGIGDEEDEDEDEGRGKA